MSDENAKIIVIGGSSGSIPVLMQIIEAIPESFKIPVIMIIHRMRNVESELKQILSSTKKIIEPEDKEGVRGGKIYLAPQNYHLLVEEDKTFSLDYSEAIHYSRPSIDVSFESIAHVYKKQALGILLSGANNDGAAGMRAIAAKGGRCIVQMPSTAEYSIMPEAALKNNIKADILKPEEIVNTLLALLN